MFEKLKSLFKKKTKKVNETAYDEGVMEEPKQELNLKKSSLVMDEDEILSEYVQFLKHVSEEDLYETFINARAVEKIIKSPNYDLFYKQNTLSQIKILHDENIIHSFTPIQHGAIIDFLDQTTFVKDLLDQLKIDLKIEQNGEYSNFTLKEIAVAENKDYKITFIVNNKAYEGLIPRRVFSFLDRVKH